MNLKRPNARQSLVLLFSSFFVLTLIFQNFSSATDVTATDPYHFLVMNVCVDAQDHVLPLDALHCGPNKSRDLKPGESLPYFAADFAPVTAEARACGSARSYAFPLGLDGSDQTSAETPLIALWQTAVETCTPSEPSRNDRVDVLAIFADAAHVVGGVGGYQSGWNVNLGEGYTRVNTRGLGRFDGVETMPAGLLAGETRVSALSSRNYEMGAAEQALTLMPAHRPDNASSRLTPQKAVSIAKQMKFTFGPATNHPQGAARADLETIVSLNFSRADSKGDSPAVDTGTSEHVYATRELGYATRREEWRAFDRDPDALRLAAGAFDAQSCGTPASVSGKISARFALDEVRDLIVTIDGRERHVYAQAALSIDSASGQKTIRTWYMTDCHDFTNVHVATLMDAKAALAKDPATRGVFAPAFLNLFGVDNY